MATWTDLSAAFAFGTKLTSAQQGQLRDNITALSEEAAGAPILMPQWMPFTGLAGIMSTASASYVTVGGSFFYKRSDHGTIRCVAALGNTSFDASYLEVWINSTQYAVVNYTGAGPSTQQDTGNISGLSDDALYKIDIRMKQVGGGTATCYALAIFVE